VNKLVSESARVSAYDPKGAEKAVEWKLLDPAKVRLVDNPIDACDGAEALILATEWPEFRER
jgi:UDPglucose 6-dehydrogenase